jgi:SPP1 gp7 family putative phage head morphogenesis protein
MATTSTRNVLSSSWLVAQKQLALARKRFADRVRAVFDALPTVLAKRVARLGFKALSQFQAVFDDALRNATELMLAHLGDLLADARESFRKAVAAGNAEEALQILAAVLKKQQLSESVEFTEEWEVSDLLARFRRGRWDGTIDPTDAARMVAALAFPPPSRQEVEDALRRPLPGGLDWDTRLRSWAQPLRGQILSQLIDGLANGENVTDLEQRLRPITGGLAYKAWRIANTEAGKVMMRDYLSRVEGAGDLLAGQQIVAVMDERTRPAHAARHGTIYWRQQNGEYRSERGDLMPDLPDAPNCRCIFIPVMQPPPAAGADLVRTADNKLIADHLSYADWWEQASEAERKKAVGAKRYETMQQILGGQTPNWLDFLDADGKRLLTPDELRAEHPALRLLRITELKRQAIEQSLQYRDVYSRLTVADAEEVPKIVFRRLGWNPLSQKAQTAVEWAYLRGMGLAGPEGRQEAMRRASWLNTMHTAQEAVQEAVARLNRVTQLQQLADAFYGRAQHVMAGMSVDEWDTLRTVREKMRVYAGTAYVIESFFLPRDQRADLRGFQVLNALKQRLGPDGMSYDWTIEKAMSMLSRICGSHVRNALNNIGGKKLRFGGPVSRSYYRLGQGLVRMDPGQGPSVVAHEVGHALEEAIPQLGQECLRYYEDATRGSTPIEVLPGEFVRQRTDGRLWPDVPDYDLLRSTQPRPVRYMGKDYGGRATEITSLVLETIFSERPGDLKELLRNSPDIVELVLRHLR